MLRAASYRHHKPSGQAVVTLDGRDFYLGKFGTTESRAEYDRLLDEWLANGRRLPAAASGKGADTTINELILAYLHLADAYYVKNGKPTTEPVDIRLALRPLRRLYGDTLAIDFGPLALKTVRQSMIESGLCRSEVNKRIRHVVRAIKWAVGEEIVPPSVHHGLRAVSGLRRGRADVRESEPVKPVPDAFVDAIRPHVSRQVWAMIQLQSLSGMRPGEVCIMRSCDLDTTGRVWAYRPESHRTEHHGRERRIHLGPQAQEILLPWLRAELAWIPTEGELPNKMPRTYKRTRIAPSVSFRLYTTLGRSARMQSPKDQVQLLVTHPGDGDIHLVALGGDQQRIVVTPGGAMAA
jgi:integrase